MFKASQQKLGVRIALGVVVAFLGVGMLLYLIPGAGTDTTTGTDSVAQVGDQAISMADVRNALTRISQSQQIPAALQPLYVQQVLRELIFEKELELEAKDLGIQVSDQERAQRIRQLIPTAFVGNSFVGDDAYAAQVQERTNLSVPEFEDMVGQGLLEDKFREMVTDGVNVTPAEIDQEFRRRNDKIKINYVVIKPDDLQTKINPSDAELSAYFKQNQGRYAMPETRVLSYAFLNMDTLRAHESISDADIQQYYMQNLDRYKLQDRVHVAHILFKTVGMTDSQIQELLAKAQGVDKKAKAPGANFGDLAKQYSDDTTKDKGGDLDWIMRGQTVPEFEKVAFSLPKGEVSDVVKTPYGLEIIKVLDRETARTQTLDEVKPQIVAALQQDKANQDAQMISDQIADDIRRSGRVPLEDLAKKYNLMLGETMPISTGATVPEVGDSPEIADTIYNLRVGDESAPIQTDKGYVVFYVKSIQPAHPATLAEVRDKVLADYRRDKAADLAKTDATDLAKAAQSQGLEKAAKAAGFSVEMSDQVARGASIPDIGNVSQVQDAFKLNVGQVGMPVFLGANWVVYSLADHQLPNMADLAAQKDDISKQLLAANRDMAFEAFRDALDARMKQEGKLQINEDNLKRLNSPTGS